MMCVCSLIPQCITQGKKPRMRTAVQARMSRAASQDPKDTPSQPSSTSHRPPAASCRATATWYNDSGSDDSRRWSDQLSLDEKDGFIFVNYSEGQSRPHLQTPL